MVQMTHLDTLVDLRPPQDDRWSFHARKFPRITRSVSDRPPIRKLEVLTEQSGKSVLHPPDNSAFVALKSAQDRKDNLAENWEESQETKSIGASMIMDRGLRKLLRKDADLTRALFSESLSGGGGANLSFHAKTRPWRILREIELFWSLENESSGFIVHQRTTEYLIGGGGRERVYTARNKPFELFWSLSGALFDIQNPWKSKVLWTHNWGEYGPKEPRKNIKKNFNTSSPPYFRENILAQILAKLDIPIQNDYISQQFPKRCIRLQTRTLL